MPMHNADEAISSDLTAPHADTARRARRIAGDLGGAGHRPPRLGQQQRGGVQVAQGPGPLAHDPGRRGPGQIVHQQVEHLQGLVGRNGRHAGGERHQGGDLPVRGEVGDRGRAHGFGVPDQLGDPARRNRPHPDLPVRPAVAVQLDVSVDRADQALGVEGGRSPAQPVQPGDPRALGNGQQPQQVLALGVVGNPGQLPPQPRLGPFPDGGDQALQGADPGSRTLASTSRAVAWSNSTIGRSLPSRQRTYNQRASANHCQASKSL